jgi:hypothetical protein
VVIAQTKELTMEKVDDTGSAKNLCSAGPQIEFLPIDVIRANPANARAHSRRQIRKIVKTRRTLTPPKTTMNGLIFLYFSRVYEGS